MATAAILNAGFVPDKTIRRTPAKRQRSYDCPGALPQLQLNERLSDIKRHQQSQADVRQRLNDLAYRAQLPKDKIADILNVNVVTLWRMMTGETPIRDSVAQHIRSIEHIERDGRYTHVVYDTGAPSPRWDFMNKSRRRQRGHALHMQCQMQD